MAAIRRILSMDPINLQKCNNQHCREYRRNGADADPFMLHIYAALAEQERRMISARTKAASSAPNA
jgi:DNA invertase Pin-like site-specific DNA recombinase